MDYIKPEVLTLGAAKELIAGKIPIKFQDARHKTALAYELDE